MRFFDYFKVRRLQIDILTAFSILFISASVIILTLTYQKNSEVILLFSNKILKGLEKDANNHMHLLLEDAKHVAVIGGFLIHNEKDVSLDNPILATFMLGILKYHPYIDNYFIGTMTGSFLEAMRIYPKAQLPADFPPFPPNSKFAYRYIDRRGPKPEATWVFMDENQNVLEKKTWNIIDYDPRLRPWYVSTQPEKLFWTDIYIFNETSHLGLTASLPVYDVKNHPYAVVGVDLSLETVSDFLKKEEIGKTGKSLIMTKSGVIIASSFELDDQEKKKKLTTIHDLSNPIFSAAYQYSKTQKQNSFIFKYDGVEYLVLFASMDFQAKEPWMVEIIVPVTDFLANIIEINHHLILILSIIFLFSVFIIYFLAKKIAKPIVLLSHEIDKIREFDLDSPVNVRSHIKEIIQITGSVSTMKAAIREFSHFVPKQLVQQLIMKGHAIRLGGDKKEITIFFSDIFNFTSISEKMSPEKLMLHLSEYFNELTTIIMNNQGTIDKYSGDNIMAFWGAPTHDEDQRLHACTTALLCQKKLAELNQKWQLEEKPLLLTRIGIHKGEVIVGNVGSSDRMNYTVIGDPVNVASRLESINKVYHTKIIVSQEVIEQLGSSFLVRPLDIVAVKGRTTGTKIYELLAQLKGNDLLLPDPKQLELSQKFTQAFETFHERKWQDALKLFEEIEQSFPEDMPTQIYIERCKNFIINPPAKDWTGVTSSQVK